MQVTFDDHTLDTERRELLRGGAVIAVQPQEFDLLVYLVQNREHVVSKDDLIALVWQGRIVSDSTLTSRINAARSAIGDSGKDQKLIRTIPRKGVRFVGSVIEELRAPQPAAAPVQESRTRPASPLSERPAIAVLPFTNMSGQPEQEYFSDGISEDIITALSKLRWFFVIARNSSFIYKGNADHLKQIAEELGVHYVVEGSVRKDGDLVRITAQLIGATTGSHVWAEHYDRDLTDVFAVQDEITDAIVATIEPKIYVAENFRARRKPPNSLDAWDLVMRDWYGGTNRGCRGSSERAAPRATEYLACLDRQSIAVEVGLGPRALPGGFPPGRLGLTAGQPGAGPRPGAPTRSSIDALLPRSCFRSLLETVIDLTAADTDVLQLPVTEQAQRGVLRLTFVPRNCRNSQAIGEAT
jgi:TolB-like protein